MGISSKENFDKIERKVVKKVTKVTNPEMLKQYLFGDKSIDLNNCIQTNKITKISKKQKVLKSESKEYIEKDGYKKCTCCGEIKPILEYYNHDITNDGYRYFCKKCFKEDAKTRYYKNKE